MLNNLQVPGVDHEVGGVGLDGTALNQTVTGTQVSPLGNVYKADLPQLTPSTSYSWQVTSGSDVSDVGSFVTAPTDGSRVPFRFVVYGDNRTNDSDHAKVVAGIQAHSPDFVVNTGDLEDTLTTFNYVTFFSIEKALLERVGIFPCPGNHDIASIYQSGFGRPNNYTWRWANAAFVVVSATDPIFGDSYAVGSTPYNSIQ